MTLSTTTNAVSYAGNGVTTQFDFSFLIPSGALVVYLTQNGTASVMGSGQYSVTGLGGAYGGTITVATPPVSGQIITIRREMPMIQDVALVTGAAIYAEVVEGALDRLVMADQQLAEGLNRAVKVPVGSGDNPADYMGIIERGAAAATSSASAAAQSASEAAASAQSALSSSTNAADSAATAQAARDQAQSGAAQAAASAITAASQAGTATSAAANAIASAGAVYAQHRINANTLWGDYRTQYPGNVDLGALPPATAPFTDERIPAVRISLAQGSVTTNFGGL